MRRSLLQCIRALVTVCLLSAAVGAGAATFKRGVNIDNWLSQNDPSKPYGAPWFTEQDVAWIAHQGFDHIRFPIDMRIWFKPDGSLDESKVAPFDRALSWVRKYKLGAILDAHFIEGANFNTGKDSDLRVFTDPVLMRKAEAMWRTLARRYAGEGDYLRFELINEPKAETNAELNVYSMNMLAVIRRVSPTRFVYFPVNKWNTIPNLPDVELPANDPNVGVTIHFYEPMIFTHQRAPWAFPGGARMPAVPFPGRVPDMQGFVPPGSAALQHSGEELTVAKDIGDRFATAVRWSQGPGKGREVLLGEFGVYYAADPQSTINWVRAVRQECERDGFGWCVWGYRSVFPVRLKDGSPAPMLKGLFQD